MSDRKHLAPCGICPAAEGQPCSPTVTHVGRRWEIGLTHPGHLHIGADGALAADHGACRPTVETNHVWDYTTRDDHDGCDGQMIYRGACLGCGWHGPTRTDENDAVDDAHDHALPGWRDLPVVPRIPHDTKDATVTPWYRDVVALYDAHGIASSWLPGTGAPIRTYRRPHGTRSHWSHEIKAYDLSAGQEPEHVDYTPQLSLFS